MKIQLLMEHLRHDVVAACDAAVKKEVNIKLQDLERRFACEGWPFLTKLGDAYKAALGGLCLTGDIPDVLPHLGRTFSANRGWGDRSRFRALACLSWPSKLTFAGESEGSADWSGFRDRSRECANFAGASFEDIIPMSRSVRASIQRWAPCRVRPLAGKHGPGATAERLIAWDKWLALDQPTRPVIRMTSVPKDRLKRRLIGIEHAKMQFIQQGLAASLRATPWFRSWINLEDQAAHVRFAADRCNKFSAWGDPSGVCTIDLSDASDRIPPSLVEYLLPDWYPSLAVASSSYAELPSSERLGDDLIPLGMMATMGNGFCFELETLVFHIVASLCGRIYDEESGMTPSSLEYYATRCRVYGDDVIIPSPWLPVVERVFAQLGWRISLHKTAVANSFLETCGTYITAKDLKKRFCPTLSTADARGVHPDIVWESTRSRLDTAMAALRADLPITARCIASPVLQAAQFRWNHKFHRHEIRLSAVEDVTRPLNVTELTRLHAYWVCGLTEQTREPTGKKRLVTSWVPWRDYSDLASVSLLPAS